MVWITSHLPLYFNRYPSEGVQILAVGAETKKYGLSHWQQKKLNSVQVSFFLFTVTYIFL